MEEQVISIETSKLSKEKGFDIEGHKYYKAFQPTTDDLNTILIINKIKSNWNFRSNAGLYLAPTQTLLQKWLREKCELEILITLWKGRWVESIYDFSDNKVYGEGLHEGRKGYKTYEEALEKGLLEGLKLI